MCPVLVKRARSRARESSGRSPSKKDPKEELMFMKNTIVNHGRKLVPVLPLAAFLMTAPALWHWAYPPTPSAQITTPLPWTSIGAGGTVDELSLPDFGFSPPGLPNGM